MTSINLNRPTDSQVLFTYKPPIKGRQIDVLYDPIKGLSGIIRLFDAQGKVLGATAPVPLTGLSSEIANCKEVDKLKIIFAQTHLVPEKGSDGRVNRISVHVSGLGGVRSAIPFQPGLALGSIVKCDTLEKMEDYAEKMAAREGREKRIKEISDKIVELRTKIKSEKAALKSLEAPPPATDAKDEEKEDTEIATAVNNASIAASKKFIELWRSEINNQVKIIETLIRKSEEENKTMIDLPDLPNFQQGMESPINKFTSIPRVLPLGFDSINFNSEYFDMKQNDSSLEDQASSSARSSQFGAKGNYLFASAEVSHSWANAKSQRLSQIKNSKTAEGVLVVNATVTTRNVRCFTNIQFDKQKLKSLLDAMKSNDENTLKRCGITLRDVYKRSPNGAVILDAQGKPEVEKQEKCVYILTEAILGGSFTAFVTVLDEDVMSRKREKTGDENKNSTSANVTLRFGSGGGSIGFATDSSSGSQTENDKARQLTKSNIKIDFISQGAIPVFARQSIQRELINQLEGNPANYELSQQDQDDAKALSTKTSQVELAEIQQKRRMKMETAQVALLNTFRGLSTTKEEQRLHNAESVMQAYENFAKQIGEDENCGIPVGFNYEVFTQDRLTQILNELEGKKTEEKKE